MNSFTLFCHCVVLCSVIVLLICVFKIGICGSFGFCCLSEFLCFIISSAVCGMIVFLLLLLPFGINLLSAVRIS